MTGREHSARERTLIELLRLLADGLSDVREGVRGDGGSVPLRTHAADCKLRHSGLRCSCWVRSLDELHRCLRLMHAGGSVKHGPWTPERLEVRRLWYAVHRRYVVAERRPMLVRVVKGVPRPPANVEVVGLVNTLDLDKRGNGESRLLCETWDSSVDLQAATRGVAWLADTYRGMPALPVELMSREAA